MVLAGKLMTELGIKTPADRFFKLFASELHEVQKHCERVHHTKLHEGEDWHHTDSVKHWTYVIDGKVHTCHEKVEEIDEKNKKGTYKLFGGDIDEHYKDFKLIIEVIDKGDGTSAVKWTVEYVKINEDIDPPNGWMDYLCKCTRDIDAHLVKQAKVAI
ncbi:putative START-like domain-containing protein [Medicago truncatula]|uniref:Pathogenesis-related protein bet V I family protein n=1 Tax=Medicago truncatula TaxID=3880 RepID=B7FHH7_MEDTR|nr:MLP-like protein 28 [Medicago truncatula]ACJ84206.1 unknown [Medicago truncatula]AET02678.1 pathogenesis-related protein bet V I family protein [Medicago truncatula]AFK34602.1 unknown [Medicago truncatula]RHN40533.1 putative START-like domain-containing protein [Medicago truncatula]